MKQQFPHIYVYKGEIYPNAKELSKQNDIGRAFFRKLMIKGMIQKILLTAKAKSYVQDKLQPNS